MVIFDLQTHGGCYRPKTLVQGQKQHQGNTKNVFDKKNSLTNLILYERQPQVRKIDPSDLR